MKTEDFVPRRQIESYTLAFYDRHGCFDEMHFDPYKLSDMEYALFYLLLNAERSDEDYGRLFVNFTDGSQGEISFEMSGRADEEP